MAAAVGAGDDPALHAADTLAAGRGICRPSAVELLTDEAPARIAWLRELGVRFDDGLGARGRPLARAASCTPAARTRDATSRTS